jgi:hypothetical protein
VKTITFPAHLGWRSSMADMNWRAQSSSGVDVFERRRERKRRGKEASGLDSTNDGDAARKTPTPRSTRPREPSVN